MGDHGGGQDEMALAAKELDSEARASDARVLFIGDLYAKSRVQMRELLAKRGLPTDEDHAGIHDTSALLALETAPGQWVREDKLSLADAKTGVQGHPQFGTPELGKIYNDMKVDLALKQIRCHVAADVVIGIGSGLQCRLERRGGKQFVAENMDRIGEVRAANIVMTMAVAGRFLGTYQNRRSAVLIEAQPIDAGRRGVAPAAEFMPTLLIATPELAGEVRAVESRDARYWLPAAIDQHRVERLDEFAEAPRGQALISDGVDHGRIFEKARPPCGAGQGVLDIAILSFRRR